MPVYNGAKYLKETIDNVLLQTYRDFIFLIINDGSTDETEQIIISYTDPRIKYIKNQKNLGLVETLNKGIDLVETEFMARMDADDLWVETKLQKQLEVMDKSPAVGICGTSIRKFGAFEKDFYFPVDNLGLKVGFIFYCCMSHPSVVYRMSFLKETGLRYRADYFPAEDYKMWLECLKFTQIHNISEILVYYRQHSTQITKESNSTQVALTNKVRLEVIEDLTTELTQQEKELHLNHFVKSDIHSRNDYKFFKKWSAKLIELNRSKNFVFDQTILKNAMKKHTQAAYMGFLKKRYFQDSSISALCRYIMSFDWIYLQLRYNLKLFFRR